MHPIETREEKGLQIHHDANASALEAAWFNAAPPPSSRTPRMTPVPPPPAPAPRLDDEIADAWFR
jgi:hypothetical protein